jgi:hypothetical protein
MEKALQSAFSSSFSTAAKDVLANAAGTRLEWTPEVVTESSPCNPPGGEVWLI